MVFNSNFVATIKANGKVLNENRTTEGAIYLLPFQSEYSILLKNLNSKRALVNISIDGEDVLNGNSIVILPQQTFELERFVENLNEGNKFKFIEKTEQISNHRGNNISDGIISISYRFEIEFPIISPNRNILRNTNSGEYSWNTNNSPLLCNSYDGSIHNSSMVYSSSVGSTISDSGITVKGEKSNQTFTTTTIGLLESRTHVINIMLRGEISNKPIDKFITSREKIECPTCGTKNKPHYKFCPTCGTIVNPI